jgi:hypothetical protein
MVLQRPIESTDKNRKYSRPWHTAFSDTVSACARAMGYASFICLSLASRAVSDGRGSPNKVEFLLSKPVQIVFG